MAGIEQRLRDALRARAHDVEPTPQLWQRVDARIARRRRWRVVSFALAGAGAAAAAVLVVPALLTTTGPEPPEIADAPVAPEEAPEEAPDEDEPDVSADNGAAAEDPFTAPDSDDVPDLGEPLPEPVVLLGAQWLRLLDSDAIAPIDLTWLPGDGLAGFREVAVRPGSTPDDLTVLVRARDYDDVEHVRWAAFVDAEPVGEGHPFDEDHAVETGAADGASLSGPVWSPDGDSLAYLETVGGAVTLHTHGWDDGPGTGDTATDNAAFELVELGGSGWAELDAWVPTGDGATELWLRSDLTDGYLAVRLERQADGAWARPGGGTAEERPFAVDAPAEALAPGAQDVADRVRWSLHVGDEGPVVVDDPEREPITNSVPELLFDEDHTTRPWVESIGTGFAVRGTDGETWFRREPGRFERLPVSAIDLGVVR